MIKELREKTLKISEIFHSIEGEGVQQGKLTTFIRLFGCNLFDAGQRCTYCDTEYSYKGIIEEMTFKQILSKIKYSNITITGGEPLAQLEVVFLIEFLVEQGFVLNLETNGSIALAGVLPKYLLPHTRLHIACDYKYWDFKIDNLNHLHTGDCLKVVLNSEIEFHNFINFWQDNIARNHKFGFPIYLTPTNKGLKTSKLVECFENYKTVLVDSSLFGYFENQVSIRLQMQKHLEVK